MPCPTCTGDPIMCLDATTDGSPITMAECSVGYYNNNQAFTMSVWESIDGLKTKKKIVHAAPARSPIIAKGDTITVQATGVVKETDMKFWSTKDPGQQPFEYQAGVGYVITGWDQGLLGAAVGETLKLDIPAAEGYSAKGFPAWGLPANGGLFFTIVRRPRRRLSSR